MRFAGQTVIITGAAGGLGSAMAARVRGRGRPRSPSWTGPAAPGRA